MQALKFTSSFKPARWLRNPHCQTLWQNFLRRAPQVSTRRERLELADGDFVDLNWTVNAAVGSPLVIILHGLQSSITSNYARGIIHAIEQRGWRAVFMHFRGCSGAPNRLARHYHAGDTDDLIALITVLSSREPHTPLLALGYSLGGNVLLKYLGETGVDTPLRGAVAVSTPFDLNDSIRRLNSGVSRLYERRFLRSLLKSAREKFALSGVPDGMSDLSGVRSIRDYDNSLTAPLHGFRDAEDYYTRSSSRQYLKDIAIPTLILHAADDPFMTPQAIPQPDELSASIHLEVSACGGHIGFVSGDYPWKTDYWLERRIPVFFESVLAALEVVADSPAELADSK